MTFNPIPRWGGLYAPPYHISAFFSGSIYPRRLQLYFKFKFCNYVTPEIGFGSKKFSYSAWEATKVGWVAHFLLRFCLEIDYDFTFSESKWSFLVEFEIERPQKLKQKIKTYSKFSFLIRFKGLAQKLEELERFYGGETKNAKYWPVSYTHLTLPTNREV